MKTMRLVKTRFYALILAVITLVGIIPTSAYAASPYVGELENVEVIQEENNVVAEEKSENCIEEVEKMEQVEADSIVTYTGEDYNGGWAMSAATQVVYHSSIPSVGYQIGTIYKNEGITVLWLNGDNSVAHIEYSTPNGTKRGFLYNPQIQFHRDNNSVARVTTTSSVYYGENVNQYQQAGTVYEGEFVVVLGKLRGWAYIEYNTPAGRKRGYVSEYNLEIFYWARLGGFDSKQYELSSYWVTGRQTVYSGPSTQYYVVGSVDDGEVVYHGESYYNADGVSFTYIEYYVNGTSMRKSGYIRG